MAEIHNLKVGTSANSWVEISSAVFNSLYLTYAAKYPVSSVTYFCTDVYQSLFEDGSADALALLESTHPAASYNRNMIAVADDDCDSYYFFLNHPYICDCSFVSAGGVDIYKLILGSTTLFHRQVGFGINPPTPIYLSKTSTSITWTIYNNDKSMAVNAYTKLGSGGTWELKGTINAATSSSSSVTKQYTGLDGNTAYTIYHKNTRNDLSMLETAEVYSSSTTTDARAWTYIAEYPVEFPCDYYVYGEYDGTNLTTQRSVAANALASAYPPNTTTPIGAIAMVEIYNTCYSEYTCYKYELTAE